ncbi:MAG: pitrilysin family protein [Gemmatimonadota bacterium]|jgi:predicted Zn-dependent peptidase
MNAKRRFLRSPGWGWKGAVASLTLLVAWLPQGSALAQEPADPPGLELPVVEDTLPNGMRFMVLTRPGAPTVSFVLRFDVGSVNEEPGRTGMGHLLEHLLFKGTTTIGSEDLDRELALFPRIDAAEGLLARARAQDADSSVVDWLLQRARMLEDSAAEVARPDAFTRILTENGARNVNATTTYESTTFYMRLPANRAELWFVMEADRMANPVFRGFYTERDVVAEERRSRVETTAAGALMEAFYRTAYREHPYGVPVIGRMSDIESLQRAEVRRYHRRFYGPDNAVAAIVGDVDPGEVLRWARKYFGPIPPAEKPAAVTTVEPPQQGERRVEVVSDAAPQIAMGWHVPSGYSPDMPALSVLSRLLAGGKTSRLYRRLVTEEDLAAWVSASVGPAFRYPQLLIIQAQPLDGVSSRRLEAAVYDELARLRREAPSPLEFRRVRNQLEVADVHRLASNLGLAFQLAESAACYGDWRETFRSGQRIEAVTPDDVQRVARVYLRPENRTVATLVKPSTSTATEGRRR